MDTVPAAEFICLDVANGYSQTFVDFIRRIREKFERFLIFQFW